MGKKELQQTIFKMIEEQERDFLTIFLELRYLGSGRICEALERLVARNKIVQHPQTKVYSIVK